MPPPVAVAVLERLLLPQTRQEQGPYLRLPLQPLMRPLSGAVCEALREPVRGRGPPWIVCLCHRQFDPCSARGCVWAMPLDG